MGDGLTVQGLHKRFGDIQALSGVDLRVPRGELVGFLGPNGAGKTTTMRAVLGLNRVDQGTITWDGHPINVDDRRRIGYMPQDRGLYPRMKVHEHITYLGRLAGLDETVASTRADEWIERVSLTDRRDDLIQTLSTGNQQRVQLAVALVHEPDLLVLDEPFAGLDPVAVSVMSEVMTEQVERGASVVFSSHQLELVQDLARTVTIVAAGVTRATGDVSDLRRQSPHRVLTIQWADEVPAWSPPGGEPIEAPPATTAWNLPADADASALIREAAAHGAFTSVSWEAPSLDKIFLELVTS